MSIFAKIIQHGRLVSTDEKRDRLARYKEEAFFASELEKLGAIYPRVEMATPTAPYAIVYRYADGKLTSDYNLQFDPMPIFLMEHEVDGFNDQPRTSYFFETEEDAMLFRMKYEGKRDD